ncbi:hypothetical protein HDU96_000762 [Phlyctochytrium bullatum]|nr:hypothetical protein HDU96_000762 [Phlyctochytrium bullatum]
MASQQHRAETAVTVDSRGLMSSSASADSKSTAPNGDRSHASESVMMSMVLLGGAIMVLLFPQVPPTMRVSIVGSVFLLAAAVAKVVLRKEEFKREEMWRALRHLFEMLMVLLVMTANPAHPFMAGDLVPMMVHYYFLYTHHPWNNRAITPGFALAACLSASNFFRDASNPQHFLSFSEVFFMVYVCMIAGSVVFPAAPRPASSGSASDETSPLLPTNGSMDSAVKDASVEYRRFKGLVTYVAVFSVFQYLTSTAMHKRD